jgi:hypothetical protein
MLVCAIDRRDGSVVLWRIYHEFLLSVYCYISLHDVIASTLWAWKIVDHESIEVITDSLSTFQRPETVPQDAPGRDIPQPTLETSSCLSTRSKRTRRMCRLRLCRKAIIFDHHRPRVVSIPTLSRHEEEEGRKVWESGHNSEGGREGSECERCIVNCSLAMSDVYIPHDGN